jgi:hypothetical protein
VRVDPTDGPGLTAAWHRCVKHGIIDGIKRSTANEFGYRNLPENPTPRALRIEAAALYAFGRERFGPILLADGYACCGEEDARGERQARAIEDARMLRMAAKMIARGSL